MGLVDFCAKISKRRESRPRRPAGTGRSNGRPTWSSGFGLRRAYAALTTWRGRLFSQTGGGTWSD